jgi:hypothetical protein
MHIEPGVLNATKVFGKRELAGRKVAAVSAPATT